VSHEAYVLDVTILAECARGDIGLIDTVQRFDAEHNTLIVPALAITAAINDAGGSDDHAALIRGICRLAGTRFAGITEVDDAADLAHMSRQLDLDRLWDVQTAEVALHHNCPILTLDHDRWKPAIDATAGDLMVIEVADPD
jgi:hypothetical protein